MEAYWFFVCCYSISLEMIIRENEREKKKYHNVVLQDRRYLSLEKARNKSLQVDWVAEPAPGKCPLPSAIIACQLGGYTTV